MGNADPAVLAAFQAVPREYFHYEYPDHRATPGDAYEDNPKPWGLGYGSALSDYLGQAYMTQVCKPQPGEVTLEVGTGSGFQSSLLSRIVKTAYSIEIIEPLGKAVGKIFAPIGYNNVHTRVGDGYYGWPEVDGGFDIVIVTCAATFAPPDLFKQLKPGGRMIIPIGQPFKRGQVLYIYSKDTDGKIHSRRDIGVFFIPMTGAIAKNQPMPEAVSDHSPTKTRPGNREARVRVRGLVIRLLRCEDGLLRRPSRPTRSPSLLGNVIIHAIDALSLTLSSRRIAPSPKHEWLTLRDRPCRSIRD